MGELKEETVSLTRFTHLKWVDSPDSSLHLSQVQSYSAAVYLSRCFWLVLFLLLKIKQNHHHQKYVCIVDTGLILTFYAKTGNFHVYFCSSSYPHFSTHSYS